MRKNILFIGGVVNQISQCHKISQHLPEHNLYFAPFYVDGLLELLRRRGLLESNGAGNKHMNLCLAYMQAHDLQIDPRGDERPYDLVVTCTDLYVQKNIRGRKMILVQEGMTDPENLIYHLVKAFRLPRYLASTAATGLSHAYDYFCVASQGYRDLFIGKGVDPRKIRITGIPNFDNCAAALDNDFPYHGYVLAATSDLRETFKYENREAFIEKCLNIADGRQLIFKLHPNENLARATREINTWAPDALAYASGNTDQMIANCDVLITQYSTVVYVGIALGKEVYSDFDVEHLRRLTPIQNRGDSARHIAEICHCVLDEREVPEAFGDAREQRTSEPGELLLEVKG